MASQGPIFVASSSDCQSGTYGGSIGTESWSTPGNASASDGSFATVALGPGTDSVCLSWMPFAFSWSEEISILGVEVEIGLTYDTNSVGKDSVVCLVDQGVGDLIGSNKAKATVYTAGTPYVQTYGGPTDTWGTTLTSAQTLGLAYSATNPDGSLSCTAKIDYAKMTVFFAGSPAGPNYPATGADQGDSGLGVWSNISNAFVKDGEYADSGTMDVGQTSTLRLTNYGFSLPDDVGILGIELEVVFLSLGEGEGSSPTGADNVISLVRSGSQVGSNLAQITAGGYEPGVPRAVVYGGPTSLWGTTWTTAQIEDSSFGVDLKYEDFFSGNLTAGIDFARIKVYYSGVQTVEPTGIASAQSFGTVSITNTNTISPTGIASAQSFGSPSVAPGAVSIAPTGIASAQSFGSPTLTPGAVSIAPSGITSAEAVGSPSVANTNTISPTGIVSAQAFGTITLVYDQTFSPTAIPSAEALGSIGVGGSIIPTGIASAEAVGSPTIVPGAVSIHPTGWNEGAFPSPHILNTNTISPTGIVSAQSFGSTSVANLPTYRVPITIAAGKVGEVLEDILLPITVSLVEAHYTGSLVFVNESGEVLTSTGTTVDEYGTVKSNVKWDRIEPDTDTVFYLQYS